MQQSRLTLLPAIATCHAQTNVEKAARTAHRELPLSYSFMTEPIVCPDSLCGAMRLSYCVFHLQTCRFSTTIAGSTTGCLVRRHEDFIAPSSATTPLHEDSHNDISMIENKLTVTFPASRCCLQIQEPANTIELFESEGSNLQWVLLSADEQVRIMQWIARAIHAK
jgi:hypothetical protein